MQRIGRVRACVPDAPLPRPDALGPERHERKWEERCGGAGEEAT